MKRKELKEKFIEIANLVRITGDYYSKSLTDFKAIDSNLNKIIDLETQGDRIQEQINLHYKDEKSIPFLAIDRVRLLQRIDDTLDAILLACKTLKTFGAGLPNDFQDKIKELSELLSKITNSFAQGVTIIYESFKDALEETQKIEELRDNAMNLAFNIEGNYFLENSTKWKEFFAVREILKKTMTVISSTKKASEILEIMALKYD